VWASNNANPTPAADMMVRNRRLGRRPVANASAVARLTLPRTPDTSGVGSAIVFWPGVEGLEGDWAAHSDAGMAPVRVVPALYPLEDGVGKFIPGPPYSWVEQLELHRAPERLHHRIVVAIPDGWNGCVWNGCVGYDPTGQILSAWIAKEELRALCATAAGGGNPGEIRDRLWVFYQWCADAQTTELTTLAETIESWWPAIEVFLTTELNTPEPADQVGETRRLRIPEPRELPPPSTVALHPAHPPIVSEKPDGARLRSKSLNSAVRFSGVVRSIGATIMFVAGAAGAVG
jgi:hypothetical protein